MSDNPYHKQAAEAARRIMETGDTVGTIAAAIRAAVCADRESIAIHLRMRAENAAHLAKTADHRGAEHLGDIHTAVELALRGEADRIAPEPAARHIEGEDRIGDVWVGNTVLGGRGVVKAFDNENVTLTHQSQQVTVPWSLLREAGWTRESRGE